MGPIGLMTVLSRGGPMQEDYPANQDSYVDGVLKQHWEKNKQPNMAINHSFEASEFVSSIYFHLLILNTH